MSNAIKIHQGKAIINDIGMIVALVSFAMLFLTLLMGLAIYRFTTPTWPPQGMIRPSLSYPLVSTCMIFISSLFYIYYEKHVLKNKWALGLTTAFGFAFMVTQCLFWEQLKRGGLTPSAGIFPSLIYAFTWIHAAHIVLALLLLCWLLFSVPRPNNDEELVIRSSNVGKFWHFLGIVWLFIFLTIFVL